MCQVFIPPMLRPLTDDADQVTVEGHTVREIIAALEERHPGIRQRLCDGDELTAGLTVAVDGNVSSLGLLTKVDAQSEVHFLPAIGGG